MFLEMSVDIIPFLEILPGTETAGVHVGLKRKNRSSEEDEVSGFFVISHLWMRGYFRLG